MRQHFLKNSEEISIETLMKSLWNRLKENYSKVNITYKYCKVCFISIKAVYFLD